MKLIMGSCEAIPGFLIQNTNSIVNVAHKNSLLYNPRANIIQYGHGILVQK